MSVPKRDRDGWYLLEVTTTTKGVGGRRDNSGSSWRLVHILEETDITILTSLASELSRLVPLSFSID